MGDSMVHKSMKTILILIGIYLLYIVIFCVVIPFFYKPKENPSWKPTVNLSQLKKTGVSSDKVVLLQDRQDSGLARLQLIKNAKKSIDISTYAIQKGTYTDLFFASLFEAADRGVRVSIVIDGIVNQFNKGNP